jgi:hypothetical protein
VNPKIARIRFQHNDFWSLVDVDAVTVQRIRGEVAHPPRPKAGRNSTSWVRPSPLKDVRLLPPLRRRIARPTSVVWQHISIVRPSRLLSWLGACTGGAGAPRI